jgi:hypothetical protein
MFTGGVNKHPSGEFDKILCLRDGREHGLYLGGGTQAAGAGEVVLVIFGVLRFKYFYV